MNFDEAPLLFSEETPKHVLLNEKNAAVIAKAPVKNGKGITLNGNANVINGNATTTQVANNDTNSDRIKYVYVREHEHMHHGHSHAHSHIHSAPDSISSVAYMVRNISNSLKM